LTRDLTLDYERGWPKGLAFAEALAAAESRDRQAGTTHVGPHRADLRIALDGRAIQDEASRGQQKLAAASLILAQAAIYGRGRGGSVLLVDDPAAELDSGSLERLLSSLETIKAQLIFTGLTPSQLPPHAGSAVFHVERGTLRAL
jgi:DNA replication and repair protein RecF